MELLLTFDALKRLPNQNYINLFIPYLPYARQDRIMVNGEPLSIKVMANLLNSLECGRIFVYDVHSSVSTALINNCVNIDNHSLVGVAVNKECDCLLVSPDAGASKKMYDVAKFIDRNEFVHCEKVRDVATGKITGIEVGMSDVYLKGRTCVIVDDICDGGATFTALATELKKRGAKRVVLVVSHGIFSKGIEILRANNIDHVYTTDSISSDTPDKTFVTKFKIADLVRWNL